MANCAAAAVLSTPLPSNSAGASPSCSLLFSPLGTSISSYGVRQVRGPSDGAKVRSRRAFSGSFQGSRGSFNLSKLSSAKGSATFFRRDSCKSGLVTVCASIEEGVKSTETGSNGDIRPSTSNSDPQKVDSPTTSSSNPFAKGKISSRIAAKQVGDSQQLLSASIAQKAVPPKKSVKVANPPEAGKLSANAASQLKVARPPSVFTVPTKPADGMPASPFIQPGASKPVSPLTEPGDTKPESPSNPFRKTPVVPSDWEQAGARKAGSGKRVLDAFRDGDKGGITTKFGQPMVPKNIFDEVRRTPEEIAADAFKFEINPGQLLLASSFVVVVAIMFGTVFLVWKLGGIHYNEF